MTGPIQPVGDLLRAWRQRRRLSQFELACEAEISTRHLSFLEAGRSLPSREMLLHLAEHLSVPLRERNALLIAAGYAPTFPERALDDPALQSAHQAIELVLAGHEPLPALAVDRHWTLVTANKAAARLMVGVAETLLKPPINVLRESLHPDGLAPRIVNLGEWRSHVLTQLRHQVSVSADPVLAELPDELTTLPVPAGSRAQAAPRSDVAVPFRLATAAGVLSFITTITVFGPTSALSLFRRLERRRNAGVRKCQSELWC